MAEEEPALIWTEKYRPRSLDEVVDQNEVTSRLRAYVKTGNMPHLLFAGPAGTGKTTCAIALARELYREAWQGNFQELNASSDRGIDVVRGRIKEYARVATMGSRVGFKIIFLDEADALTGDAQAALRRTMEMYTRTARFIFSVNFSSRIIEPIQSRCAVFRFRPLRPEDVEKYVNRISKGEGLKITPEGMEALIYLGRGDLRRITNALQVAGAVSRTIDADTLYRAATTARPEEVKELLETALQGKFLEARAALDNLLVEYGLSGEDILRQLHRTVFNLSIPDPFKVRIVDRIGEADFRVVEGANERIQLEALLAHMVLLGKEMKGLSG